MRSTTTQTILGFLGMVALVIGLAAPGLAAPPANNPGQPFAEIQALIAILNDKIEAVQESIDNLSSAGGDHPTLRWDQKLSAADRFEVLAAFNGEVVLDKETGLVWEQAPLTSIPSWSDARLQCTNRTTGGRKGWRLPSVHELASLVDPSVAAPGPTIPPGHPFTDVQVQTHGYWSATTNAVFPIVAWVVHFGDGTVTDSNKTGNSHVWCARGGMNADQY